jgi:hypothetical protein
MQLSLPAQIEKLNFEIELIEYNRMKISENHLMDRKCLILFKLTFLKKQIKKSEKLLKNIDSILKIKYDKLSKLKEKECYVSQEFEKRTKEVNSLIYY